MTQELLPRRPDGCLSDFALDELIAARSLHAEVAPERAAHVATCSRCAKRLAEFEAVEPPLLELPRPAWVLKRARRFTSVAQAVLASAILVGGFGVWHWRESTVAPGSIPDTPDAATRTKGAISLVVIVQDASGNVRRLTPKDFVHPGESMRFELTVAQPGHAGVVGLDAAGTTTVYVPAEGALISVEQRVPLTLPGAIVMDETLGTERLVAVSCNAPYSVQQLKEAGKRALAAEGGVPSRVRRLDLPCAQATVDIQKKPTP